MHGFAVPGIAAAAAAAAAVVVAAVGPAHWGSSQGETYYTAAGVVVAVAGRLVDGDEAALAFDDSSRLGYLVGNQGEGIQGFAAVAVGLEERFAAIAVVGCRGGNVRENVGRVLGAVSASQVRLDY